LIYSAVISEEEARAKILESVSTLPAERVALRNALERFAAEEVRATVPLPAFDNSAMDGYAVIASDATNGARLRIVGEQPAGIARTLRISAGQSVRIFTGAPVPENADAIVMQEQTVRDGDHVSIGTDEVRPGDFIRKTGGDLAVGQRIVERGQKLGAATLALIASQGRSDIEVHQRASVAVVTTGDEVVSSGAELRAGEIYDSNGVMLAALAQRTGAKVLMEEHCRDEMDPLCQTLGDSLRADVLVISGGVSVGEHDLVRHALGKLGANPALWRVSIKPGKPFLFGRRGNCAVFGLPGNAVSSFVTFLVFVRPALLRMMGACAAELELPRTCARLRDEITGDETRPHYFRGKLVRDEFTLTGPQESHALFGLARANALLRVGAGERLSAGELVQVLLIP
jgi:molybdopterin molybdotransferase